MRSGRESLLRSFQKGDRTSLIGAHLSDSARMSACSVCSEAFRVGLHVGFVLMCEKCAARTVDVWSTLGRT
jgi:hypothetical protein